GRCHGLHHTALCDRLHSLEHPGDHDHAIVDLCITAAVVGHIEASCAGGIGTACCRDRVERTDHVPSRYLLLGGPWSYPRSLSATLPCFHHDPDQRGHAACHAPPHRQVAGTIASGPSSTFGS